MTEKEYAFSTLQRAVGRCKTAGKESRIHFASFAPKCFRKVGGNGYARYSDRVFKAQAFVPVEVASVRM